MKVIVLKPTLVQDAEGFACIATVNKVVEIEDNRATHFINSGIAKLAPKSAKLSPLERYEATGPVRQESEATAIGKAIAKAIRGEPEDEAPPIKSNKAVLADEADDEDDSEE